MSLQTFLIEDAKVEWAKVARPVANKFKPGIMEYSINVAVTDADIKGLESMGIKTEVFNPSTEAMQSRYKTCDTLGKFLVLKRIAKMDETSNITNSPSVFDADGKTPFTGLIGNGSTCDVQVLVCTNEDPTGKTRTKVRLGNITVKDLVVYEGKAGETAADLTTSEVAEKLKSLS